MIYTEYETIYIVRPELPEDALKAISDKVSQPIQRGFYKAFYNWGHFIGRCPFLVMVVSALLGILGATRLVLATWLL